MAPLAIPLLIAGTAVGVASSALGAAAAVQQGKFATKIAEENEQLSREIGERNAQMELQAAGIEEGRFRRESSRSIESRAARFGASGVVVGQGSPLGVLADQAAEAEEEALLIRHGGRIRAEQARFGADLAVRQAQISQIETKQQAAAQATFLGAQAIGQGITGGQSLAILG